MVFERFEEKHDPAKDCQKVPDQDLTYYKNKLPDDLLAFWAESGWCSYGDGLLWTVNPSDYSEILKEWIKDGGELHAFVRTAFGSIVFWDGKLAHFLDVLSGDVSTLFDTMDFNFDGSLSDDKYLDAVVRQKIFKEALPRLGPPARDECYAFVPALPLGGSESADTLQKVKLREHLHLLMQLMQDDEE
jgi:hypothetical protein